MIKNQQLLDQNYLNTGEISQDNFPSWTKFNIKELNEIDKHATYSASVLMGRYLVVLVNTQSFKKQRYYDFDGYHSKFEPDETSLMAFNLEDHSVQEISIDIGPFKDNEDYSFLKYDENKIIKCGGDSDWSLACLTIESFEPFKVECEEIDDEKIRRFSWHTAQIFQDDLYIYGQVEDDPDQPPQRDYNWKCFKTTGEAPELYHASHSFLFHDCFYVYGAIKENSGLTELFMLNFDSLEWIKVKQEESYLNCRDVKSHHPKVGGTIFKDHLAVLERALRIEDNALCFLNLQTKNTWSTFSIESMKKTEKVVNRKAHNLLIYKNLVLCLGETDKYLLVTALNLDNFGISPPELTEEEHLSSLFLSEAKSDVTFKIQDRLIPAHKRLLVKKSRYFTNLFKSGMIESRQDIIAVQDCEYDIFKEYLRFIYQDRVLFDNENQTIKLYILADKYLQMDLCKKCINSLSHNINKENVYRIRDFAYQENIPELNIWCIKFLKDYINVHNVVELLTYLNSQEDPSFKNINQEFRVFVFHFVLENYFDIYENENGEMQLFQNFYAKNLEMDNLSTLVSFLRHSEKLPENQNNSSGGLEKPGQKVQFSDHFQFVDDESVPLSQDERRLFQKKTTPKTKDLFKERTLPLRQVVSSFIYKNKDSVMANEISNDLPDFWKDFILCMPKKSPNKIQESVVTINQDNKNKDSQQKYKKKRMESNQHDQHEIKKETPLLKKTKKS